MTEMTTRLSLPLLAANQAQKHVTHNEALALLDRLVHLSVSDADRIVAPAVPDEGDSHLVADGAAGVWATRSRSIATWVQGRWQFLVPRRGWRVWVASTGALLVFDGSAWAPVQGQNSTNLLGINATATGQNRLTVASAASLFNHDGAGHQLKLNKAAATDTASLLYQTAFSGRAELGLAGDDDLQVKVSPDGSTWLTALSIDRTSGIVATPLTPRRDKSTAIRTFFVRTDGDDGNSGAVNTPAGAFRTIQKAVDTVLGSIDLGGFDCIIQVEPGTYAGGITVFSPQVGAGRIILSGDTANPANVTISSGMATGIHVSGIGSRLFIRGLRVTNTGFAGWHADAGGFIQSLGANEIGSTGSFHIVADGPSLVVMGSPLRVSGNCSGSHLLAQNNGTINVTGGAWTFTGSPGFGSSFVNAISGGVIVAFANTFTGTISGARYFATLNGTIQTNGGGATYFPGSTAGAVATGGQYG